MENLTPYCYQANNSESYNTLAAYIVASPLNASFFPKRLTIVVTPKEDEEETFKDVGKFIDDEGLSFHINPILEGESEYDLLENEVTPSCIIQAYLYKILAENAQKEDVAKSLQTRLEACESNLVSVKKDKDSYYKWWQDESAKRSRLEESIKAFRTLLNAVVE